MIILPNDFLLFFLLFFNLSTLCGFFYTRILTWRVVVIIMISHASDVEGFLCQWEVEEILVEIKFMFLVRGMLMFTKYEH